MYVSRHLFKIQQEREVFKIQQEREVFKIQQEREKEKEREMPPRGAASAIRAARTRAVQALNEAKMNTEEKGKLEGRKEIVQKKRRKKNKYKMNMGVCM